MLKLINFIYLKKVIKDLNVIIVNYLGNLIENICLETYFIYNGCWKRLCIKNFESFHNEKNDFFK
jgi:hypothetical protein